MPDGSMGQLVFVIYINLDLESQIHEQSQSTDITADGNTRNLTILLYKYNDSTYV